MNRRAFLKGLVGTAAGLVIPQAVAAEPESRIWQLDKTMLGRGERVTREVIDEAAFSLQSDWLDVSNPNDEPFLRKGDHIQIEVSPSSQAAWYDTYYRSLMQEKKRVEDQLIYGMNYPQAIEAEWHMVGMAKPLNGKIGDIPPSGDAPRFANHHSGPQRVYTWDLLRYSENHSSSLFMVDGQGNLMPIRIG